MIWLPLSLKKWQASSYSRSWALCRVHYKLSMLSCAAGTSLAPILFSYSNILLFCHCLTAHFISNLHQGQLQIMRSQGRCENEALSNLVQKMFFLFHEHIQLATDTAVLCNWELRPAKGTHTSPVLHLSLCSPLNTTLHLPSEAQAPHCLKSPHTGSGPTGIFRYQENIKENENNNHTIIES